MRGSSVRSIFTRVKDAVKENHQTERKLVNPRIAEKEIEQLLVMLTGENNPIERLADPTEENRSLVTRKEDIRVPNKLPITQGADVYNLTKLQKEKAYPFVAFGFNDVIYSSISNYLPQQYRDYFNYSTDQISDKHVSYTIDQQIGQQQEGFYNLIYQFGRDTKKITEQVTLSKNELNIRIEFPQEVKEVVIETITQNSTPESTCTGVFSKVLEKVSVMPELSKYSRSAVIIAYLSMFSEIPNSNKNYLSRLSSDLLKSINGSMLLGLSTTEIKKFVQFVLRETPIHAFIYEPLHKHIVQGILEKSLGLDDFVENTSDVNFKIEYFNFLVSSRDMRGSFKVLDDLINGHNVVPAAEYLIDYLKLLTTFIYEGMNADNLNKRMLMNMLSAPLAKSLQGETTIPIVLELAKWIGRPEESIWFLNYILRFSNINNIVEQAQTTLLVYLTTELSSTIDFDERNINRTTTRLARAMKLTTIIDKLETQFGCKINTKSAKYITKLYTEYGIYPSAIRWFERAGGLSAFGQPEVEELRQIIKANDKNKENPEYEGKDSSEEEEEAYSTDIQQKKKKKIFKDTAQLPLQSSIYSNSSNFYSLLTV